MKGRYALAYFILLIGMVLIGWYMLSRLNSNRETAVVGDPSGWFVEKVEETVVSQGNRTTRTLIERESVSIESQQGSTLRVIQHVAPNKLHSVKYQIGADGNRQLMMKSIIIDNRVGDKIYQYKVKYFVQDVIPDEETLIDIICQRYNVNKSDVKIDTYCGRVSLSLTANRQSPVVIYLDKGTGVELARYRWSSEGWQPIWQFKSARFYLKRGRTRGLYEVQCGR